MAVRRIRLTAAGMIPWAACPVAAQTLPAPRETVAAIATEIERTFYDPARAASIARDLRREAGREAFDKLANPYNLANALSERLGREDGHFRVVWTKEEAGPGRSGERASAPRARRAEPAAHNFRSVSILPGNLGYIELRQFDHFEWADANAPARRAADSAFALVSGDDAIILDLRENGGGSPHMVGYLASAFVGPSRDVYNVFHSREGTESERPQVRFSAPMLDVPCTS